ncbi:MAG TPA: DUF1488 family protein [Vineibacter sp.]|nr:DUF1488 family protein [Vineibacter sp.]
MSLAFPRQDRMFLREAVEVAFVGENDGALVPCRIGGDALAKLSGRHRPVGDVALDVFDKFRARIEDIARRLHAEGRIDNNIVRIRGTDL